MAYSLHIDRLGVIPQRVTIRGSGGSSPTLSFPPMASVNEGIDPELCSLSYVSVDELANIVMHLGTGALMAKVDVESAYRLIPVHLYDRPLQAVEWKGRTYVDPMLPFRLRSAPKIYSTVADALEGMLRQAGVCHSRRHYLDDFIVLGPPGSAACQEALDTLATLCRKQRVTSPTGPPHKQVSPTTCLVFLGIEVDSVAGQLRLPADKLARLSSALIDWGERQSCTRKELESLIGHLNHACKVVRSGRSFLRRMIDLLHTRRQSRRGPIPIRLNTGFQADLAWWQEFLLWWNGVSFLPSSSNLPTTVLSTDASGSWGSGGWWQDVWCQIQWPPQAQALSIAEKELIPIILWPVTLGASSGLDHKSSAIRRMVQIHLKVSKCDQFGGGTNIILGATDDALCPVKAMVLFVTERGCALSPFFHKASGETATKSWFVGEVREILAKCGLNQSDFAGHSFRIGATTTAALAGIEDSAIQVLGRWHSTAFLRYVRNTKERPETLSASLS